MTPLREMQKLRKSMPKKRSTRSLTGETLRSGDKIVLVGFGSFSVAKKPERTGRNPRTGAAIRIAPRNVVKFRAGAELSDMLK